MKNISVKTDNRKSSIFGKGSRNLVLAGLLGAALITLLPATGLARRGNIYGPPDADQITCRMTTSLNLTEEQKKKVQPVIEAEMAKRRELMEKASAEREQHRQQMRTQMEKIDQETEAALAGVLTAEQRQEYAKMLEERRQFRQERMEMRGGRGGRGPMGKGMGMGGWGPCGGYGPYGDCPNW